MKYFSFFSINITLFLTLQQNRKNGITPSINNKVIETTVGDDKYTIALFTNKQNGYEHTVITNNIDDFILEIIKGRYKKGEVQLTNIENIFVQYIEKNDYKSLYKSLSKKFQKSIKKRELKKVVYSYKYINNKFFSMFTKSDMKHCIF